MFIFRKGYKTECTAGVDGWEGPSPGLGTTGTHQLKYAQLRNINRNAKYYQWIKTQWYASTETKHGRRRKYHKKKKSSKLMFSHIKVTGLRTLK